MAASLKLASRDGIAGIEEELLRCQRALRASPRDLNVYLSGSGPSFFGDIWAAIALAACLPDARESDIVARGMRNWSEPSSYMRFGTTPAALVAIQRGVQIFTDRRPRTALDAGLVQKLIQREGGVFDDGAHRRYIVELDPQLPVSRALVSAVSRGAALKEFLLSSFYLMEINARGASADSLNESADKQALVRWLNELHANAYEHGRIDNCVRFLRVEKHQAPRLDILLKHAAGNTPLQSYLREQVGDNPHGPLNFVEASVSDFGPGILDAFGKSFAGAGLAARLERNDLLRRILHEQLSSKSGEPSAGLGIQHALQAAWSLDAFVSLRTAEFALAMRGRLDGEPVLTFQEGNRAQVEGTHWQLVLPDRKVRG